MRRIACLWVPDLCLRAHVRVDPELTDKPLALTDGVGARCTVFAVSAAAERAGISPGMRVAQARAMCEAALIRPISDESIASAMTALADVAASVSARVEIADQGRVYLDCGGSALLYASESALAAVLAVRAERQGFSVRIGIADSKLAAAAAARESAGVRIVPPGQTRAFLSPLPIARLDPDPESAKQLARWGMRFIGDLALLPTGAVAHRLGPAGLALARRARGEDDDPLVVQPGPHSFEETLALDYGIDNLEPLIFSLRRLIECVTNRIALHGFACGELELRFRLGNGGRDIRRIAAAAPTVEHKVYVTLVRAELERRPLAQPVITMTIVAAAVRPRATQLDLLRPVGPEPAALASALARLAILCGPGRVGMLRSADSHRPEAVEVRPFDAAIASPNVATSEAPARPGPVVRLALRAFRPVVPLEVYESAGRLDYVRGDGFGGRVVQYAGPWRLRGEWWTTEPFAREYYDVELSDGGVYRIFRDVRGQRWLADGVYD